MEKQILIGDHVITTPDRGDGLVYVVYEMKVFKSGEICYKMHLANDKTYQTVADAEEIEVLQGPFRPMGWKADQGIQLGDRVRVCEGIYAVRAVVFPVGTEGVVCEIREPKPGRSEFKMFVVAVPTPFEDDEGNIWGDPQTQELDRKAIATGYFNDELELVSRFDLSGKNLISRLEKELPPHLCIRLAQRVEFNGDSETSIPLSVFAGLHAPHVAAISKWGVISFEAHNFSLCFDLARQVFTIWEKQEEKK